MLGPFFCFIQSFFRSSMAKKRERHQNPQPFLAGDNDTVSSKKRSKSREERKQLQKEEKLLSSGISSKILKESLLQQREIEDEQLQAQHPNNSLLTVTEKPVRQDVEEEEDDIDDFKGFDDTLSRYGDYEVSFFFLIFYFVFNSDYGQFLEPMFNRLAFEPKMKIFCWKNKRILCLSV